MEVNKLERTNNTVTCIAHREKPLLSLKNYIKEFNRHNRVPHLPDNTWCSSSQIVHMGGAHHGPTHCRSLFWEHSIEGRGFPSSFHRLLNLLLSVGTCEVSGFLCDHKVPYLSWIISGVSRPAGMDVIPLGVTSLP